MKLLTALAWKADALPQWAAFFSNIKPPSSLSGSPIYRPQLYPLLRGASNSLQSASLASLSLLSGSMANTPHTTI